MKKIVEILETGGIEEAKAEAKLILTSGFELEAEEIAKKRVETKHSLNISTTGTTVGLRYGCLGYFCHYCDN